MSLRVRGYIFKVYIGLGLKVGQFLSTPSAVHLINLVVNPSYHGVITHHLVAHTPESAPFN